MAALSSFSLPITFPISSHVSASNHAALQKLSFQHVYNSELKLLCRWEAGNVWLGLGKMTEVTFLE